MSLCLLLLLTGNLPSETLAALCMGRAHNFSAMAKIDLENESEYKYRLENRPSHVSIVD